MVAGCKLMVCWLQVTGAGYWFMVEGVPDTGCTVIATGYTIFCYEIDD
jgi:hypothetical protein